MTNEIRNYIKIILNGIETTEEMITFIEKGVSKALLFSPDRPTDFYKFCGWLLNIVDAEYSAWMAGAR